MKSVSSRKKTEKIIALCVAFGGIIMPNFAPIKEGDKKPLQKERILKQNNK